MRSRFAAVALALVACLGFCPPALAQMSDAVHHDRVVTGRAGAGAKFLERKALPDAHDDEEATRPRDHCPANLRLRWMTEVSSSVYSTPVVADLFDDGHREILVPSFVHHLEVLEGDDGAKAGGDWPVFHASTAHASPLVHDFGSGGGVEILLPLYDGEVRFFDRRGRVVADPEGRPKVLRVPPLAVRRRWYVNLAPDHVDHAHPDVGADDRERFVSGFRAPDDLASHAPNAALSRDFFSSSGDEDATAKARRRLLAEEDSAGSADAEAGAERGPDRLTEDAARSFSVFDDTEEGGGSGSDSAYDYARGGHGEVVDGAGALREPGGDSDFDENESAASHYLSDYEADEEDYLEFRADGAGEGDGDGGGAGEAADGDRKEKLPSPPRGAPADLPGHGEGVPDVGPRDKAPPAAPDHPSRTRRSKRRRGGWEDERFHHHHHRARARGEDEREGEFVHVDAHLLCTPSVADVDGDGRAEIVLSVSYFFDREYYDDPARAGELPPGIDIGKYVAGGVYVADAETLAFKWHAHLDLSTDAVSFRAYVYSSPTLADVNGDGRAEIVVGTSVGFLYVLDGSDGSCLRGWPKQMGEIQGQVAALDLDGSGEMALVAADTRGSVAAFSGRTGEELWERHLASLVANGVVAGDVDGDGRLEVVLGTSSGAVHVLDAETGEIKAPFPFYTGGKVMAPIALSPLSKDASRNPGSGLSLVVASFDGFLYVIDGRRACADVFDIGETSYGMPLVEDLTGDGKMNVVVATMNGNVYAFDAADAAHHPLHAVASHPHAGNNVVARGGAFGVFGRDRGYHDVRGGTITVPFTIVDERGAKTGRRRDDDPGSTREEKRGERSRAEKATSKNGPYVATVTVTAPGGFARSANATFATPGEYALTLEIPNRRVRGRVTVRVADARAIFAEDAYGVSFHARFYRVLKWVLVLPFTAACAVVLRVAAEGAELPTTRARGGVQKVA